MRCLCGTVTAFAETLWGEFKGMPSRILIVDDHEVVRLGVRTLFADNRSFKVCGEAENGLDAIRMVLELSPDVVILDLTMPGMNGFETAEKIMAIAPAVRVVFFSAHQIPATADWVGADAFVSKSSNLQELTFAVSHALQSGKNIQAQQKWFSATSSSRR